MKEDGVKNISLKRFGLFILRKSLKMFRHLLDDIFAVLYDR